MLRKNTIGLTSALVLALLAVFAGGPARAQVCEYPLFIQEGAVDANVLFLFDNSGSMNEIIFHDDFDPSVTYTGGLESGKTYYVSSNGNYTPRSFRFGQPNTPSVYLIESDNNEDGRYWGNYLNWIYWHATAAQRASIPLVTRVQAAKAAVNDIVFGTENIRFGVMRFNYEEGGTLAAPLGTPVADLLTYVNGITANTWTPLAETMVNILDYYKQTGSGAPIQYACQKNFIVCVTDGYPTKDKNIPSYIGDYDGDGLDPGTCVSIGCMTCGNDDCTHYLDDVALYIRQNDLRSDLEGTQVAFTYVVGFGIDAPLLAETAKDGGGFYTTASNAEQLQNSLENILRDIVDRISSGSAVAVVSTEGQDEDLLYRGKFVPGQWRGYLEAFELPYESGEEPLWEAGALVNARDPASRNLFTSVGGSAVDFEVDNAAALMTELGVATTEDAEDLINWVAGQNVAGLRDRGGWILSDVVDSSPLVVGPPSSFHLENDYLAFREALQSRARMIYIGANDGMLHAFVAEDGSESWAYIPNNCLGDLSELADSQYCHQYFVNLTPAAVDAYVNGSWRTILLGGQKQGGGAYFAIDVTYPESPELMWEVVLPAVNESWAKPEVYRSSVTDSYVMVIGTGPDYTTGEAHVIGLDLATGAEVWNELLSTSSSGVNMATAAATVDLEFDGYEDLLYIADLEGNLWRYDLKENPPDKSLLFRTDSQPIQAQPILTVDYNNDVFLYFGTGQYVASADIDDASLQTFYSIIDNHSETQVSRSNLVDQTYDITELKTDDRGWYIDLVQTSGERITEPDALVSEIVYFTSYAPDDEPCSAGGFSWFYKVKFRSGAAEDDDEDDSNDGIDGRVEDLGEGVATKPVIDIANENVIVQGSDTRIHVRDTVNNLRQLIVRSWRQLYN